MYWAHAPRQLEEDYKIMSQIQFHMTETFVEHYPIMTVWLYLVPSLLEFFFSLVIL